MDDKLIAEGMSLILKGMSVDPTDHNFFDTPARYAKALGELFAQHNGPPTAFEEQYTDFILVRDHEMWTLCPHHMFPVRMRVSLAYIPDGKVLGLSKLVRVMQKANSGPIMQERFTCAVRSAMEKALETEELEGYNTNQNGICVLVEGWHGCMELRGVRSKASTITMASSGLFDSDAKMLDRFMLLVGRR